jgi:tripeptide aminopeptidase
LPIQAGLYDRAVAVSSSAVLSLFVELAAIPSPPGEERAAADRVLEELRALGLEADEDGAGAQIGSTMGNILCRLPGRVEGGTPIFFCAHLDTVPPTGPLEPVVEDGVVRNAGGTILGADNKAAVAAMLEAARRIVTEGLPHAGVELLFTPMEEIGLRGAKAFDASRLEAELGYVYDQSGPIGEIIVGAPTHRNVFATFSGQAAHAGMFPEEGRSAILAAARAIADLRLGRIDEETTANVGIIEGGTSRNVVPERCRVEAEVRSHDEAKLAELVQETLDMLSYAASVSDCAVEAEVVEVYRGYRFAPDDPPVRLARAALERCGYEVSLVRTGGGADANVFNAAGLPCVNIANAMMAIHTPEEHIAVADIEGMVEVTLALVDIARG